MPITPLALTPGTTLTATSAVIATAPAGETQVRAPTFSNPTVAAVSLTVTLTRSGGSALTIIPTRVVNTMATDAAREIVGLVLGQGDTLSASGAGLVAVISALVVS